MDETQTRAHQLCQPVQAAPVDRTLRGAALAGDGVEASANGYINRNQLPAWLRGVRF